MIETVLTLWLLGVCISLFLHFTDRICSFVLVRGRLHDVTILASLL